MRSARPPSLARVGQPAAAERRARAYAAVGCLVGLGGTLGWATLDHARLDVATGPVRPAALLTSRDATVAHDSASLRGSQLADLAAGPDAAESAPDAASARSRSGGAQATAMLDAETTGSDGLYGEDYDLVLAQHAARSGREEVDDDE